MVKKITKGDRVYFNGSSGRIPNGTHGTVKETDGALLTVEWDGNAPGGPNWRTEDKKVFLSSVKPSPKISKGDRVQYVTKLTGTPVPNGAQGTVKKSDGPFLFVEWDGKAPGGYNWHWSDKDVLTSHVKLLPKKMSKAMSKPAAKRNSKRTSRLESER